MFRVIPSLSGIDIYSEAFLADMFFSLSLQGAWVCWTMTRWSSVTCTDRYFMGRRTGAKPRLCLLPPQLKGTEWQYTEVQSTLISVSSKSAKELLRNVLLQTDQKQRSQCFDVISKCSVTVITGVFLSVLWPLLYKCMLALSSLTTVYIWLCISPQSANIV